VPQIDLIPEVTYGPLDPYHYLFDNMPLKNILTRISLVNDAVDIATDILRASVGTQGSLDARLNVSLNPNGTIKTAAVDTSLHNIGYHADGVGPDSIEYVRMKKDESDKLVQIADGATNLKFQIDTISTTVLFDTGIVEIENTPGISWTVSGGNIVKANLGFPVASAHKHNYDVEPASSDYLNYQNSTVATPCVAGTLRVYVNGYRLTTSDTFLVPIGTTPTPTLLSFTPNETAGTFVLSTAISSADIIRVDFDTAFI
jgi:hypothetical protein